MYNGSNGFSADPEATMAKGKAISEIYENYQAEHKKVLAIADDIAANWSGADSTGYVSAIHSYEKDFEQLGQVIGQIGDILYRHGQKLANSRDKLINISSRL